MQLGDHSAPIEVENAPNRARDTPHQHKRKREEIEDGGEGAHALLSLPQALTSEASQSPRGGSPKPPSMIELEVKAADDGSPCQKKRKKDYEKEDTLIRPPQIPPHRRPCGHEIHPAHKPYDHPRCPTCRVNDAMFDVRRVQDVILSRGGISAWYNKAKGQVEAKRKCENSIRGSKPKASRNGTIDLNGNDSSYRSAKARLTNLIIEFNEMSVLELAYDLAPPLKDNARDLRTQTAHMEHGATNALSLYNTEAEEGVWGRLEKKESIWMYERGRQRRWEEAVDSGNHGEHAEKFEAHIGVPSKRPRSRSPSPTYTRPRQRKRLNARVAFDTSAYVREEANVEEIRWTAIRTQHLASIASLDSWTTALYPVPNTPGATSGAIESQIKNSPGDRSNLAPKLQHEALLTLEKDGPRRNPDNSSFRRRSCRYRPGRWAASSDNTQVAGYTGNAFTPGNLPSKSHTERPME